MNEQLRISTVLANGTKVDYNVILTFKSVINGNNYVKKITFKIEAESTKYVKFYKVDKARTREYGGSGVGLSIVKAIMESMNQQYGVKNYTNGVEFWLELETK